MEKTLVRSTLKQFFNINHTTGAIHVDFDSMCVFLVRDAHRAFSPTKFEKAFVEEIKKLEGKKVCPELFDILAEYVDNMTIYIGQVGANTSEAELKKRIAKNVAAKQKR